MPPKEHTPVLRLEGAAGDVEQSGLASAVGADEAHHLAGGDFEVDATEHLGGAVGEPDVLEAEGGGLVCDGGVQEGVISLRGYCLILGGKGLTCVRSQGAQPSTILATIMPTADSNAIPAPTHASTNCNLALVTSSFVAICTRSPSSRARRVLTSSSLSVVYWSTR